MTGLFVQPGDRENEWFRVEHYDISKDYVECSNNMTCPLIDYQGREAIFKILPL